MRIRTATAGLAGALVAAVVATAVPAIAQQPPARREVRKSVATTTAEDSARVTMHIEVISGRNTSDIDFEGAYDLGGERASYTMTIASPNSGTVVPIEVRVVDGTVYMDVASLVEATGAHVDDELGDVRWVKLDPRELGAVAQAPAGSRSNPTSQVEALRGLDDVREVGQEDVAGVSTTHFSGELDLGSALAATSSESRKRIERTLGDAASDPVPVHVWIDDEHRVRQIMMTMNGVPTPDGPVVVLLQMRIEAFDVPVAVKAPPSDRVIDLDELRDLTASDA